MLKVILFTLLSISNYGFARSDIKDLCVAKDLSPDIGSNRFQGGTNWCWAFSGTDALGYALGITPGQRISPIDFVTQVLTSDKQTIEKALHKDYQDFYWSNRNSVDSLSETGYGAITGVAIYSHTGYCTDNKVRELGVDLEGGDYLRELERKFQYDYVKAVRTKMLELTEAKSCLRPEIKKFLNSANSPRDLLEISSYIVGSVSSDELSYLQKIKATETQKIAKKLAEVCSPRETIGKVLWGSLSVSTENQKKTKRELAKALSNNIPPIISMDSAFLFQKKPQKPKSPNHQGLLTGMRWNSKKRTCEFKLRNAWPCEDYPTKFRENCIDGEIWLSENEMAPLVYGADVVVGQRLLAPKSR